MLWSAGWRFGVAAALRVDLARVIWIWPNLKGSTKVDRVYVNTIDLGLVRSSSVCWRVPGELRAHVAHQAPRSRVHEFSVVLVQDLLVHERRVLRLLREAASKQQELPGQQGCQEDCSGNGHAGMWVRISHGQEEPVD